jgi:RNA recognition motif-containing protein
LLLEEVLKLKQSNEDFNELKRDLNKLKHDFDEATNKSLGFCFVKYENQRSTILAVDNFNGMKLQLFARYM